jgi:hypothetical protein
MHRHASSVAALAALLALGLSSCTSGGDDRPPTPSPSVSPAADTGATASPTPPALPEEPPRTIGPVATDCIEGWATPAEGSARYARPLHVIRLVTGVRGPLVVVDMRSFDGPESPPSEQGYLANVRRWYVKAFAKKDLSFQGRFLVEAREFGTGLVAVAPYDSNGFHSPDWVGFQYDSQDPEARAYEGLPGRWAGVPYDFVNGGAGLAIPGLPAEVAGCLSAT